MTVDGAAVSEETTFARVVFAVTFVETGLPEGTNWSITLGGVTDFGRNNLTYPGLANGTYAFTVASVAGYSPTPSVGAVYLHGKPVSSTIAFLVDAPPSGGGPGSAKFLGLPTWEGYAVAGGIAALIVVALVLSRGRGRKANCRVGPQPP